jgi:hypothetical protein
MLPVILYGSAFRDLRFGFVDKQGAKLVPEIPAQDKKAGDK